MYELEMGDLLMGVSSIFPAVHANKKYMQSVFLDLNLNPEY